jgi:hypothetical protein
MFYGDVLQELLQSVDHDLFLVFFHVYFFALTKKAEIMLQHGVAYES